MPLRYEIKCDECKTTIGRTDSVRASAAGGYCDKCREAEDLLAAAWLYRSDEMEAAAIRASLDTPTQWAA